MINYAFVLLTGSSLGGAEKRFTQLFEYLSIKYPDKFYFIITWDLYYKIQEVFPNYPIQNLVPIESKNTPNKKIFIRIGLKTKANKNRVVSKDLSLPSTIDNHPGFIKQIYRFTKSYRIQKSYYNQIYQIGKEKNIKCFLGVFDGIFPLYFYLMKRKRNVGIIFCDMDSWFNDIIPRGENYWYRKFSSFNYALENSDNIDFLSPFILDGVKKRGIKIKAEAISITPGSFTDYSKCTMGDKSIFQVVFSGRLFSKKNPILFLEASLKLSKKYPDIIFHIMGEGPLSSVIETILKKSGLSNIIFHGFHNKPNKILANSSVFVSIQTTNNYPSQSVLEAMGCGNAIIATDVGDTNMFINEKNGILIELETNELVSAIESLYLNKELTSKLGNYNYSYVRENYNIKKIADYYVNLFKNTLTKMEIG